MVCPADKPGHDISNGGTEFFRLLDRLPKDAAEHLVRSHEITIGHALNKKHKAKLHDDGLPRKRPCLACGKSFDVGTWSYGKVCCSNKCYRDADARGLDWTSTPAAPKPAPAELPWLAWNEKGIIVAAPGHKPTSESAARKLGRNARWLRLQDLEPVIRIASGMRDFQLMDFFLDLKLHTIETAPTGAGPLTWTSPEVAKRFYTADALRETAGDGATPAAKKPPKKAKPAPAAPIRKRDELTPTDPTEKSCPNCGRTGNIDTEFGWRTMNGKRKPQSRCKKCR